MEKEQVELEKSTLVFREDDIVEIRFKDYVEVELTDSKAQFEEITRRYPNQALCMLIVPGEHNTMTKEVREYAKLPTSKAISKAEAVVVKNLAQRIANNFLAKFAEKNMKLFADEESALKWLKNEAS